MDYSYTKLFQYFRRFLQPYWGKFFLGSSLRVIGSIVWLYNVYAFAEVVNFITAYHSGDSLVPLYRVIILWVAAIIVRNLAIFWAKLLCLSIGWRAGLDVQSAAVMHLSQLDISWHEKENAGNKVKRIQKGGDGISELARVWIINVIEIGVNFFGTLFIISQFDSMLALLIIGYQIVYYVISSAFRSRAVKVSQQVNIKEEESTGLLFEIVSNIRSVKVFGMGVPLLQYVREINSDLAQKIYKRIFWNHGGMLARGVWEGVARVAFVGFVIYGILNGHYELGFLVLFYGYFSTLTDAVNELSSVAQDVALAKANVGRLAELFEEPITIENDNGKRAYPSEWDGIHVRDLSFMYGDVPVLSHVSLDIKKGEKVGIVGLSGAGKSTLFKLLLKENEDYEGEILIGDVPLRSIQKSSYIHHVATVLQDTEVFNMSLRNNIVLANGGEAHNEDLFQRAITVAHVSDYLHKLPSGVESVVGEKGVRLSGGEKQRLGIARAIFKSPDVLFLDEATSHLDVESEQKIQDSLKHFFKDVTAVVIAHRLSTIREMDRIVVIENGSVIETGTFDELHARNGRFREFWDKQRV